MKSLHCIKVLGPPHILNVVGDKQGMLPAICLHFNKSYFVSVEFHGDLKNVLKVMLIWQSSFL